LQKYKKIKTQTLNLPPKLGWKLKRYCNHLAGLCSSTENILIKEKTFWLSLFSITSEEGSLLEPVEPAPNTA
jgi:hypothetical protein